jgi:hypothetical protein
MRSDDRELVAATVPIDPLDVEQSEDSRCSLTRRHHKPQSPSCHRKEEVKLEANVHLFKRLTFFNWEVDHCTPSIAKLSM